MMQSHLRRRSSQAVTNRRDAPQERIAVAGSAVTRVHEHVALAIDSKLLMLLVVAAAVTFFQSNSTDPVLVASLGLMMTYICDILGLSKRTLAALLATIALSGYTTLSVMWQQLPGGLLCLLCILGVVVMMLQLALCSLLQFK
jgi:hypothetical protein